MIGWRTRTGLIAGREFKAYVATASFWIALIIGPLAMAGALALSHVASRPAAQAKLAIQADDNGLIAAARNALARASALEGRPNPRIVTSRAESTLIVHRAPDGTIKADFTGPFTLSPTGQALVIASIERDDGRRAMGLALPVRVDTQATPAAGERIRATSASIARFGLVMMLWMTLTGSLGMLLQAVVRERANRALETLLAAAQPWEIVVGKLAGVGAVSLLVLTTWLASCTLMAAASHGATASMASFIQTLADPWLLLRALAVYILAYLLFGLVTVAVGAAAADVAAAQNLSRPMFAVLLAVFFASLAAAGETSDHLAWLVYAPPFTPFMLLLKSYSIEAHFIAVAILGMAIALAGRAALVAVTLKSNNRLLAWLPIGQPKALRHSAA